MRQLLFLSGKGGTGKTTLASAFAFFSGAEALADCDVEAPNFMLTQPKRGEVTKKPFHGLDKARMEREKCVSCGACLSVCRFSAIEKRESGYVIDTMMCEGCKVCTLVCPSSAIVMERDRTGDVNVSVDEKTLCWGELKMGRGNSGKLVYEVKKTLKEHMGEPSLVILDGPPGIGCPAVSSLAAVENVVLVTEPTKSGYSDLLRLLQMLSLLETRAYVVVNKVREENQWERKIEEASKESGCFFAGTIPYDPAVGEAINRGVSVASETGPVQQALYRVYETIINELGKE